MLIQLRQIASKWESLGIDLNFSASTLLELKNTANGSDFNCLVELCDKWLRDVYNPTWKMIAHALKEIGEDKLSIELLQIYDTGIFILQIKCDILNDPTDNIISKILDIRISNLSFI